MTHATKQSNGDWKYQCQCGKILYLSVPELKPDRLVKCFECQKTQEEIHLEEKFDND